MIQRKFKKERKKKRKKKNEYFTAAACGADGVGKPDLWAVNHQNVGTTYNF